MAKMIKLDFYKRLQEVNEASCGTNRLSYNIDMVGARIKNTWNTHLSHPANLEINTNFDK